MHNAASFADVVSKCWSRQTASLFTKQNPALGQCSVTALVAQDLLGGDLLKTRVGGAWHYYNRIGGQRVDFTSQQFSKVVDYGDVLTAREDAFTDTTRGQYEALRQSVTRHV